MPTEPPPTPPTPLTGLAANCALLFPDVPLLDRAGAAARAGLGAVEFWWPFATATPDADEVRAFVRSVQDAGVELVAMNLFAGDMPAGDRGVLSHAHRRDELLASLESVVAVAEATGVSRFNALYGRRLVDLPLARQQADAADTLALVADRLAGVGTVLLEAVSGVPGFPLFTFQDCVDLRDVVRARGHRNVGVLADLYHLATNGDDVATIVAERTEDIAHVQVADAPGRHEPGTGDLPLVEWVGALRARGYSGWLGLEYVPTGDTRDGLEHLLDL